MQSVNQQTSGVTVRNMIGIAPFSTFEDTLHIKSPFLLPYLPLYPHHLDKSPAVNRKIRRGNGENDSSDELNKVDYLHTGKEDVNLIFYVLSSKKAKRTANSADPSSFKQCLRPKTLVFHTSQS